MSAEITARVRAFRRRNDDDLNEACDIIEGLEYRLGRAATRADEAEKLCKVYEQIAKEQREELER